MGSKGCFFGLALAFVLNSILDASAGSAEIPIPSGHPECVPSPSFQIIDSSIRLQGMRDAEGRPALEALKRFKVKTIFRYYDMQDETIPGKTLQPEESDAILGAEFQIGVVFQHHNDDPAKFLDPLSGKNDGERALALADTNRQPYNSAIYFGVDGPERHIDKLIAEFKKNNGKPMSMKRRMELSAQGKTSFISSYDNFIRFGPVVFRTMDLSIVTAEMLKPAIKAYFVSIKQSFDRYAAAHEGKSFDIGMYCTGAMCLYGQSEGLAKYYWLSPEGRYDSDYLNVLTDEAKWNLQQQLETTCPGWSAMPRQSVGFDFNRLNSARQEFGQWSQKRQPD